MGWPLATRARMRVEEMARGGHCDGDILDFGFWGLEARFWGDGDGGEFEDAVGVLPGWEVGEGVGAEDEDEVGVAFGVQLFEGIDGVAGAGAAGFAVVDGEVEVVGDREAGHRQPVGGWRWGTQD